MKSFLIGSIAATTIGVAAALAQSTGDPAAKGAVANPPSTSAAQTADAGAFITKEQPGLMRAPKLVGVAVYDSNNKDVGKIADVLLDHDGSVKAVVIGVGGFLGMGGKDVAVPYSAVHWQTEQRTVAVDTAAPAHSVGGTAVAPGDKPKTKTVDPAQTEAYQGYPDRAVLDMTQAQLKTAPEFKYASNPAAPTNPAEPASATTSTSPKP